MQTVLTLLTTVIVAQSEGLPANHALVTVGNERHLWFVADSTGDEGFDLCHVSAASQPPAFLRLMRLRQSPAVLACWGDQLWVSFAQPDDPCPNGREVFTMEVRRNEALGVDYPSPSGRLDMTAALPAGTLAGLVGTADGPLALIVNEQDASLLQLRNSHWTAIDLPDELDNAGPARLAVGGSQGQRLVVFAASGSDASVTAFQRESDGAWTQSALPIALPRIQRFITVQDQIVAVSTSENGDNLEVAYLRPPALMALATLSPPTGRWSIEGFDGHLVVLEQSPESGFLMRRIDALTGMLTTPQTLATQELPKGKLWMTLGSLALGIAAIFAAYRMRAAQRVALALPSDLEVMPISSRLLAAALDLLPSAAIAALASGVSIRDLWMPPFMAAGLAQTTPYLMMVSIFAVHTSISELFTATTFGKSMVGGKITSMSGARPSKSQLVIRAIFKVIVLLIPPLVLVMFANRDSQGINDLAASTVVVREAQPPAPDARN